MLISFFQKVIFYVNDTAKNDIFALENNEQNHNLILTKLLILIHYL